ncbi:MAG: LysE family translocator, partial [Aestuariivirga sp.]
GGAYHTVFGGLGVSVILKLAPALLTALLIAGALYMAWIGSTLLRSSITVSAVGTATTRSWATAFRQGAITCMLNPKAYLFTIAVYPQFIRPQYGAVWSQALVMGVMTALMQLAIYGSLALGAAKARDGLVANPRATMIVGRVVGLVFLIAAGITAWEGWNA